MSDELMKGRLLPGIYPQRVVDNAKCRGCLHYAREMGLCEVGLQPTTCGDGSTPEFGFHPLVNTGPGQITDGHTVSAQAPSQSVPRDIKMLVSHLGDPSELLALSVQAEDLIKSRKGYVNGSANGLTNIYAGIHTNGRLNPTITAKEVAEEMFKSLSPNARQRTTVDLLEGYVSDQRAA